MRGGGGEGVPDILEKKNLHHVVSEIPGPPWSKQLFPDSNIQWHSNEMQLTKFEISQQLML